MIDNFASGPQFIDNFAPRGGQLSIGHRAALEHISISADLRILAGATYYGTFQIVPQSDAGFREKRHAGCAHEQLALKSGKEMSEAVTGGRCRR